MSLVPDYKDLGGMVFTNGNRHFKVLVGTDSAGHHGSWHVYYDGAKEFVADAPAPPPNIVPWGQPNPAMAAPAPAPAPAPTPAAPTAATPEEPHLAGSGSGQAQAPDGSHDWKQNSDGQWYWVDSSDGNHSVPGHTHVYQDGHKVFVADSPNIVPWGQPNPAMGGGTAAPAASDGGSTGGTQAPAETSPASNTSEHTHTEPVHSVTGNFGDGVASSVANTASSVASHVDGSSGQTYTVAHGDTLSGIAAAHDMSLSQLESLNPDINNPNLILPGQKINLGGHGGSDYGPVTVAPADNDFPNSSSYNTLGVSDVHANSNDNVAKAAGWADGTGNPGDPIKDIMSGVNHLVTDPLKIQDKKHDA